VHQGDREDNKFDSIVTQILSSFAQQRSRRGFLAKLSRFVLALLGVATVPLLPVNRINKKVEAANCSDWELCGMWGRPCDCCVGGTLYTCPEGWDEGGNWSYCCPDPTTGVYYRIGYIDCCRMRGTVRPCGRCSDCLNNPEGIQPVWCGWPYGKDEFPSYGCTYIQNWGPQC